MTFLISTLISTLQFEYRVGLLVHDLLTQEVGIFTYFSNSGTRLMLWLLSATSWPRLYGLLYGLLRSGV